MARASSGGKGGGGREEVLKETIELIRSRFGDGSIMRLGDRPVLEVEVIPTGILPLDVALGVGGLPRGRMVEIFGPEGSGKTTIALHAVLEAQRMGGVAAFIDAEHALNASLVRAIGIDPDSFYVSQPDSGEQALSILDALVRSGAVDVVVVDSVAALTPQAEIEGKMGESQVGLQARLMSYALRRLTSSISRSRAVVIFINQLRAQIGGASFYGAVQETTPGGRALKFYSSVRIEVKRGQAVARGEEKVGHELLMRVVKNKVAPPFKKARATLLYGLGVPRELSILEMAIDLKLVSKKGSWLYYRGEALGQGKEKAYLYLRERKDLAEEMAREALERAREVSYFDDVAPSPVEASLEEGEAPEPEIELEEEI